MKMAMTEAEKKRAQRARKKEEHRNGRDEGAALYRKPFSTFAQQDPNIGDCDMYMQLAGMEFPAFEDERHAEEFVIDRHVHGDDDLFENAEGALGRAEAMMGLLNDTAITLAGSINAYKRGEIKARIAELEQSADVDRATAMQKAVRLNKILDQLNKHVRMTFPQWKVTGN
jgi:hypothetical protein